MAFYQTGMAWPQNFVASLVPRRTCCSSLLLVAAGALVWAFIAIAATTVPTVTLRTPQTTYHLLPFWINYEFEQNNITARVGSDNSTTSFDGGNTAVNASSGVNSPVLRRRADDGAETTAASSTVATGSSTTGTATSVATTISSGTATSTDSASTSQSTETGKATEGDASLGDSDEDDQGDDISGDKGRVRQFGFLYLKNKLPQKLPLKDSVSDKAEMFKLISDKSKNQRFGNGFATGLMYVAAFFGPIVWAVLVYRKDPAQALHSKYYVIFALTAILCYIPAFVVTTVVLVKQFSIIGKSPSFPTSGTKAGLVAEYGKWWIALNVLSLVMLLLLPVAARLGEKLDMGSTHKASQAQSQNQMPEMTTSLPTQHPQQYAQQVSYSNENLATMPQVVSQPTIRQYV